MHIVEFIPANWLERVAGWPGLLVYNQPAAIERQQQVRRGCDRVEDSFGFFLSAQV